MSYQERRSIASLISTLLIGGAYLLYVFQRYQADAPANELHFWASAILIMIPVYILLKIVAIIVFTILNTIATRVQEPDIADERDRLIELKSVRSSYYTFMFGFVLAMFTAVLSMPASTLFLVLIISLLAAMILYDVAQFYFYRRGV